MLVLMITIIWNIYLVSRFLIYHNFFPKMRKRCNINVMTFKRYQNKQGRGTGGIRRTFVKAHDKR